MPPESRKHANRALYSHKPSCHWRRVIQVSLLVSAESQHVLISIAALNNYRSVILLTGSTTHHNTITVAIHRTVGKKGLKTVPK